MLELNPPKPIKFGHVGCSLAQPSFLVRNIRTKARPRFPTLRYSRTGGVAKPRLSAELRLLAAPCRKRNQHEPTQCKIDRCNYSNNKSLSSINKSLNNDKKKNRRWRFRPTSSPSFTSPEAEIEACVVVLNSIFVGVEAAWCQKLIGGTGLAQTWNPKGFPLAVDRHVGQGTTHRALAQD